MDKIRLMLIISVMLLLVACGGGNYEVEMSQAPEPETMSEVLITIMNDGEAVTDFEGNAEFRMVDMDHGTEVTDLVHTEDGVYVGEVNLPMQGKWTIDVVGDSDSHGKLDTTIEVEI